MNDISIWLSNIWITEYNSTELSSLMILTLLVKLNSLKEIRTRITRQMKKIKSNLINGSMMIERNMHMRTPGTQSYISEIFMRIKK